MDLCISFIKTSVGVYDSYEEWKRKMGTPWLKESKEFTDQKKISLGESDYYIIKQELEKIFRKRATISLEELKEYTGEYWVDPENKVHRISLLLAVYEDFFCEDENFDQNLVRETKQYFGITKEDMKRARL